MGKPKVLVVPHTRKLARLFAPADWERLHGLADVVWGRDEPMPLDDFQAALPEVTAIVHGLWTYGGAETLSRAPRLRAVIDDSTAYADSRPSAAQQGFGQSVPGMASMYVMFAVFPAVTAILLERKQWTLQRLTTMPVSRAQILGGKLLARFIVGMIQYVIVFAFGAVLGVQYGNDLLALVLIMISFVLCITALTLALTTLIKNIQQANGITLFLTLTLAPLGGAWWSLEIVPAFMKTLGHISPVAWAMDGYTSLLFFGGNLSTVLPSIGVLLGLAAVFFTFGVPFGR